MDLEVLKVIVVQQVLQDIEVHKDIMALREVKVQQDI